MPASPNHQDPSAQSLLRPSTRTLVDEKSSFFGRYLKQLIGLEISSLTRYFDQLVQYKRHSNDSGYLMELIESPSKNWIPEGTPFPDLSHESNKRTAVLLNGTFNHHFDIQGLLSELKPKLSRTSRVITVAYSPYLRGLYWLSNKLGIRSGEQPSTFITRTDIENIGRLSGYEIVRVRPIGYFPFRFLGLGGLVNRVLQAAPLLRWFGLVNVLVLRPIVPDREGKKPTLSIVIPARNEKGNIENALKRMPDLGTELEIIFVEGHSKDGTWEEIQRVVKEYGSRFKLKAFRQTGKGKNDAVRLGFAEASGDLLTILDADLTMPPELLGRFYGAYTSGLADFVNGTRLVYPMESEAMRFLNWMGNVFFAKALSSVLDVRIGDSLCGTKLVARHDYKRMIAWRKDFGDFDPFGDFELIFPAASLALGIIDIPVRYRARTYGSTNISRFYHGSMLLKMTLIGLFKIRIGKG